MSTAKNICFALLLLNGIVGPVVKYGYGYENVPEWLVGPRMLFMLGVGVLLLILYFLPSAPPPSERVEEGGYST